MPVGEVLIFMGDAQQCRFGKWLRHELKANGQPFSAEPAGHDQRGQPEKTDWAGVAWKQRHGLHGARR